VGHDGGASLDQGLELRGIATMSDPPSSASLRDAAIAQADAYYLDDGHAYGCAETAFLTLKDVYGLEHPGDASAAMAFNGGIAYSGGPCGAITGAAMAVGMLAEQRISDHRRAKAVARELVYETMRAFEAEHGAMDCRTLIGYDLRAPGQHRAFMDSGRWREACASQIRTVVGHLAPLADDATWETAVARSETGEARR
jgi:C_GCAxxG_C_C family probable redox protein